MSKANEAEKYEKFLSRRQAAAFLTERGLKISEKTLSTRATRGNGPYFEKFMGRSIYLPSQLLLWAEGERKLPDRT